MDDWAAAEEQRDEIARAVAASQPLVGQREPLAALQAEYAHSAVFSSKLREVAAQYAEIRRVRGDGSCFYRAFLVGLAEYLVAARVVRPAGPLDAFVAAAPPGAALVRTLGELQRGHEALEDAMVRGHKGLVRTGALNKRAQALEAAPQHGVLVAGGRHLAELAQQAAHDGERDAEHGQRRRNGVERRRNAARHANEPVADLARQVLHDLVGTVAESIGPRLAAGVALAAAGAAESAAEPAATPADPVGVALRDDLDLLIRAPAGVLLLRAAAACRGAGSCIGGIRCCVAARGEIGRASCRERV
jgi:hypothetical protein